TACYLSKSICGQGVRVPPRGAGSAAFGLGGSGRRCLRPVTRRARGRRNRSVRLLTGRPATSTSAVLYRLALFALPAADGGGAGGCGCGAGGGAGWRLTNVRRSVSMLSAILRRRNCGSGKLVS